MFDILYTFLFSFLMGVILTGIFIGFEHPNEYIDKIIFLGPVVISFLAFFL